MRTVPETTMVYAVYWPEFAVLKVGRAWRMSRIRGFIETGAQVLLLMRDSPTLYERAALAEMDGEYERAFDNAEQSEALLPRGRGFTECFFVPARAVTQALKTIFKGIARYGNDTSKVRDTRDVRERGSVGVAPGGAVDGVRAASVRGRRGARPDEHVADASQPLPADTGSDRADDARSSPDVGRRRVSCAVRRWRKHLLRDDGLAVSGSPIAFSVPRATAGRRLANRSRFVRGGGEGERVGRRERREGERGRSRPNHSRLNATVTILQSASRRDRQPVQGLWHGSAAA